MITLPVWFSLVYFSAFAIYIFFAIYILSIDTGATINRVFAVLCLTLSIWAFSYSISTTARDYGMALFWQRAAVLGWGIMYSCLLHFTLILTERDRLLEKGWTYWLLYLPALVNVVVFSLYSELALTHYQLVHTPAGWVNIKPSSVWDWYFYFYYGAFSIASLVLVWRWGGSAGERDKQRQARLIAVSFLVTFVLGTLTDIVLDTYLMVPFPQMAVALILIPIAVIFYSTRRYGLMVPAESSQATRAGLILSEASRNKIYRYLTLSFILGGLLNIVSRYFLSGAPLKPELMFSGILFIFGLCVQIIQRLMIKEEYKDMLSNSLIALAIPLITLRYIQFGSVTVWAISFVFVMLSVVFVKQRTIIVLGTIILLTQAWVWIRVPDTMVHLDGSDHIVRIVLLGIALWMAYYVNRVYLRRLKENEEQIRYQEMVSQTSADFITVTESTLDEKINRMLRMSGEYYQADRSYLFLYSPDQKTMRYAHEWCREGSEPGISALAVLPLDAFPWWSSQILDNTAVNIPDIDLLPPEAVEEKEFMQKQRIRSMFSIPVTNQGRILGFLGFSTMRSVKIWRKDHQEMIKVLANLLADSLTKVTAEKEINYMAYYDSLTGLPNRSLFKNRLEHAIHLARRTEKLIGVMFIDLDSFKDVNDTMGHEAGDEMLKQIANRLSRCVRGYDTVSRFGGDKFLIMLDHISQVEDIRTIADKVMRSFDRPLIVKGQEFFITSSAGIAVFPADGEDTDSLIKNADLAMYSSKEQGKNQYTLCSPVMKEDLLKKMHLINNLYRAQERDELVLYYQPQVSVVTREIIGLEALIRWKHPELGMISPGTFIPLAEQTGLINPIGQWVLWTACRQNKAWQDMGLPPVRMAVNLSVEQVRNPGLVSDVARILYETGLDPRYLELEITEGVAVKETGSVTRVLNELKELGLTIAIDDFGTEYSSLSRLKVLPIDRIKIDMQFVHGIAANNTDEAIAKVIIQLARNLNLNVTAEGVETDTQLEFFRRQMCDEIQGFYYYRPMPAEEVEAIMMSGR